MIKFKVRWLGILIFVFAGTAAAYYGMHMLQKNRILCQVIDRLGAESRLAEVLVTRVMNDPVSKKELTTIKFLEYDTRLKPLPAKYFTFSSNLIQFQSLVIRFDDYFVKKGDRLRGKSACLFMKVFALSDTQAEQFTINKINEVPSGYAVEETPGSDFEKKLWRKFWEYALDQKQAGKLGIKNAQIEAPGTRFIPGMVYTIVVEHDGGMRIDAKNLPQIIKGEKSIP